MLNRLLISQRMPASFLKMMMAALLLAFAFAWMFTACDQQPAKSIKASDTTERSQARSQRVNQRPFTSPDLSTAIEHVADKAIPAVVHIIVKEHQEMANPLYAYKDNPFFRRFFGLPKDVPKKLQRELVGIGTGVIIDAEGHILSNYHVVGGATQIEVTLSDGIQYPATVVGVDPKTDLGVIKISAEKPLSFLIFTNSDKAKVGQWVVAIGHPRGLDQTVTQGIISAKHRTGITNLGGYQDFLRDGRKQEIQVTVGNLEDAKKAVAAELKRRLGVVVRPLTANEVEDYGLSLPERVAIQWVGSQGTIGKVGFEVGDVILALGDQPVQGVDSFSKMMTSMAPHQKVVLLAISHRTGQSGYFQVETS